MHIFDFYQAVLENTIETAKRDGKYDEGIVDVKGTSITLAEPQKACVSCDIQASIPLAFKANMVHPDSRSIKCVGCR